MLKRSLVSAFIIGVLLLAILGVNGFASLSTSTQKNDAGETHIATRDSSLEMVSEKFVNTDFFSDNTVHQMRSQRIKQYLQQAQTYDEQNYHSGSSRSVQAANRLLEHHIETLQQYDNPQVVTYEIVQF